MTAALLVELWPSCAGLQMLKEWREALDGVLEPLKVTYKLVYVYHTRQLLSRDGWEYAAKRDDLLMVPRQTLPTYVPVAQDRLAVSDLLLPNC